MRSRLFLLLVIALTPASVSAQTWHTLINEEFIVPEGASLVGHVPETNLPGGTWSLGGAPGLVVHNQAVHPTGFGPLESYATIDARVSDGEVGLYLYGSQYTPADQVAGGVIFRYVDATNYMLAFYRNQGLWLWKRTPGGFVHIAYAGVDSPQNTWRWMAVQAIGSSITVNWHGVDVISVTDSTNQTATRHGFWFYSVIDPYSVIGTFRVRSQQPMQPPAVTSLTTTPNQLNLPIASSTVVTATGYSANNVVVPTATFTWASSNPAVAWIQSTTQNTAKVVASAVGTSTITVTAQSGSATFSKTITATVTNTTAQVKQVLINDEFIAPEASALTSHLPETNLSNGSWSLGGSSSVVVYNQAVRPSSAGAFDTYATIDSRSSDADVGLYWLPSSVGDQSQLAGGVIFRYASPTSYLLAHYWQEQIWLWKMTPTGFVHLANAAVPPPYGAWHWFEIRGTGPLLTVNWDGVDKIQVTEPLNQLATRHGIWWRSVADPYSTIGTFVVKGTLPEPVTSVVVTPSAVTIPSGGAAVLSAKGYGAGGTYVPGATFTWEAAPNAEVLGGPTQTSFNTAKVGGGLSTGSVPVTAALVGGTASASAQVTVVEKCLSLCVWDGFNGTGLLQSHSPEINVMDDPWEVVGGPNIAVSTTRVQPFATGAGSVALGTIEGGNANGIVSAEWLPQMGELSNPTFGLLARYVSDQEYFLATYENHRVKLFRRFVGGITQIGDAWIDDDLGASHTMQVRLDGPGIQVWWDNVQKIQAIDATNINATRHGLYFDVAKDPASSVENFIFVGTNKSIATSMEVSSTTINTVAQAYPLFLNAQSFTAGNTWIPWTSFTWHSSNSAIALVEQLDHRSARLVGLASGSVTITATSEQGLTATFQVLVTVPESDGTVRVFDAFEGSMHTFLSNHVPNRYITGAAWATNGAGNIRINDVNSLFPLRHIEIEYATIESATANGTVSANWKPLNANIYSNGGVVFRYVNNESYWYAYVIQHGLYLKRVDGSVHTTVASVGIGNPTGAIHQIAVLLDGPRIQVWFNGALQIEVSDPMNESATRHGVMFHSAYDGASNIDDFSVNTEFITPVRPPQPVLPCFNGFWPPNGAYLPTVGGTDAVTLSAPFGCAWTAEATRPWIHLTTTSGIGDAFLEYSVELNTGGQRTGAIVIDGWEFPVTQAAGGTLTMMFQVLDAAAPHSPVSGAAVTLVPDFGGTGTRFTGSDGRILYVVGGGPLQYTISKPGYVAHADSFQVTQADSRTILLQRIGEPLEGCDVSLFPSGILLGKAATTASINVSAPAGCAWTTSSTHTFVEISSGHTGVGNGVVEYSIAANLTGQERVATVHVNGAAHQITQRANVGSPLFVDPGPGADLYFDMRWNPTDNRLEFIASTRNSLIQSGYETVMAWPGLACPCEMYWESWVDAELWLQAPDGSLHDEHYEWGYIIAQHPTRHHLQPAPGQWRLNTRHRLVRDYFLVIRHPEQAPEFAFAGSIAHPEWGGFDEMKSFPVTVQPFTARLALFLNADGFSTSNPESDHDAYLPRPRLINSGQAIEAEEVEVIAAFVDQNNRIVAPPPNTALRFELSETTAIKGFAMNAGAEETPDYSLSSQTGWLTDLTMRIKLRASDFGGSTRVSVYQNDTVCEAAACQLQVPLDAPRNWLPDAGWPTGSGVSPDGGSAGDDAEPGGGSLGDGFTAFEEYRGFIALGQHVRLNPAEKDAFFQSDFTQGVGQAVQLAINFHQILGRDREWIAVGGVSQINFNVSNSGFGGSIPHQFPQRIIRIVDAGVSGGSLYGLTSHSAEPATLATLNGISIAPMTIRRNSPNDTSEQVVEQDKDLPMLLHTLAHEVGHAVGFEHYVDPADTCPASPQAWGHMIEQYYPSNQDPEWQCRWSQFPTSYRDVELQTFRLR